MLFRSGAGSADGEVVSEVVGEKRWHPGKHNGKLPKTPGVPHAARFHYEVEYSTFNDSKGYNLQDLTVRSYLKLAHKIGRYKEEKGKGKSKGKSHKKSFFAEESDEEEEEDDYEDEEENGEETALHRLQDVFKGYVDIVSDMFDATDSPHPHADHSVAKRSTEGNDGDVQIAKKRREHRRNHDKKRNRHGRNRNKAWRLFLRRAFVGILDDDDIEKFDAEISTRAEIREEVQAEHAAKVEKNHFIGEL